MSGKKMSEEMGDKYVRQICQKKMSRKMLSKKKRSEDMSEKQSEKSPKRSKKCPRNGRRNCEKIKMSGKFPKSVRELS